MDGSGKQENLSSRLAVGVPRLRQVPSSRLHRDELWPAPSPAQPPFLTREQDIDSSKIKFKESQLWRGQFLPPFAWRKLGYAAFRGWHPPYPPKETPAEVLAWEEREVTLSPLWLLPSVRKHLETWPCWEWAAPPVRQAPASKGSWDSPVPFLALLLPCCIGSASSLSLFLRASVSSKTTMSFSGH